MTSFQVYNVKRGVSVGPQVPRSIVYTHPSENNFEDEM